jgi:hypothetical protein
MNPATQTLKAAPSLVQDVKAPAQPPAAAPALVKTEVVSSIPVKAPSSPGPQLAGATAANPITSAPGSTSARASKDLDHILKEVNKDVGKIGQPTKNRFSLAELKSAGLILPAIAAIVVATILVVASVIAFRPPADHVTTRATTTGVQP